MAHSDSAAARYRLGPRSTRGLVAGWRAGQIACVATGLILAVGLLRSMGGAAGGILGFSAVAAGVAVASWPVEGRTLEQWAPVVARFALRGLFGRRDPEGGPPGRRSRGSLGHLELVELPESRDRKASPAAGSTKKDLRGPDPAGRGRRRGGGESDFAAQAVGIGAINDSASSTWTAVIPVGGTGFALLGEAERGDRIGAWSGVLAAMARETSGLHRLQWLSSIYPAWLDGTLTADGTGPPGNHYAQLVAEASPHLWAHEVYIAVTLRRNASRRSSSQSSASLLREQLSSLEERLRSAGLSPGRALSPRALADLVRRSFAVTSSALPTTWPWPVSVDDGWWRLRTDACWHASYWIAEWPRSQVTGGFLLPMLLEPGLRRIVSVTMAPVAAQKAVRRAERDRTEGTADVEMRHRHGFAVTARAVREQESRQQREAELAEGHAGYYYSGYVTVTADDPEELGRACARLEQAAALAQLDLRRLFGAQEDGFCCTLPLGRGCR
ncbi:MAG: SCO6880 family protein [Acidimicrobiales bacterium]